MENLERSKNISTRVAEARGRLLKDLDERNMDGAWMEAMEAIAVYGMNMEKKYQHAKKLLAYHVLIGSTVPDGAAGMTDEDFEGDDSMLVFLKNLRSRLLGSPDTL